MLIKFKVLNVFILLDKHNKHIQVFIRFKR